MLGQGSGCCPGNVRQRRTRPSGPTGARYSTLAEGAGCGGGGAEARGATAGWVDSAASGCIAWIGGGGACAGGGQGRREGAKQGAEWEGARFKVLRQGEVKYRICGREGAAGLAGSLGRPGRGAPKCGDPGGVAGRYKKDGVAL